mmetsp:Transcript_29293/g.87266  ORF Transcript_29293/g.87266 Transcript_29293/m.87266 type:complete len:133 (+) Transcript_29293:2-400(+)
MHLYPVHGVYTAAWVAADFPPLTSIALAPHMINDHRGREYLAALRGLRAGRSAPRTPPAWAPFRDGAACAVCSAPFVWESTCRSSAQEVCARHHCRACGRVVCGACSAHEVCLPDFGIVEPVRVCDACAWTL